MVIFPLKSWEIVSEAALLLGLSYHSVFKKNLWSLKCLLAFLFPEQHNSAATYYKESWEKFFMDCSEALAIIKLRNFSTEEHSRMTRKMKKEEQPAPLPFSLPSECLTLTWLVIILSTSQSSVLGYPCRLDVALRWGEEAAFHLCCSAHGRYRDSGPRDDCPRQKGCFVAVWQSFQQRSGISKLKIQS